MTPTHFLHKRRDPFRRSAVTRANEKEKQRGINRLTDQAKDITKLSAWERLRYEGE